MNPKNKRLFRLPWSFRRNNQPAEAGAVHFEASALAVDPDELAASDSFQEELELFQDEAAAILEELDDISAEDVEAA